MTDKCAPESFHTLLIESFDNDQKYCHKLQSHIDEWNADIYNQLKAAIKDRFNIVPKQVIHLCVKDRWTRIYDITDLKQAIFKDRKNTTFYFVEVYDFTTTTLNVHYTELTELQSNQSITINPKLPKCEINLVTNHKMMTMIISSWFHHKLFLDDMTNVIMQFYCFDDCRSDLWKYIGFPNALALSMRNRFQPELAKELGYDIEIINDWFIHSNGTYFRNESNEETEYEEFSSSGIWRCIDVVRNGFLFVKGFSDSLHEIPVGIDDADPEDWSHKTAKDLKECQYIGLNGRKNEEGEIIMRYEDEILVRFDGDEEVWVQLPDPNLRSPPKYKYEDAYIQDLMGIRISSLVRGSSFIDVYLSGDKR